MSSSELRPLCFPILFSLFDRVQFLYILASLIFSYCSISFGNNIHLEINAGKISQKLLGVMPTQKDWEDEKDFWDMPALPVAYLF